MRKYEQMVYEALCAMPVIDTHEHLETEDRQFTSNVLSDYTQHYFSCDLISSGLPAEAIPMLADENRSIAEKWALLAPYWELCRHTGYGVALDLAVRRLYGVWEINADTIEEVESGYQAIRANRGYARWLLGDVCNIEYAVNNIWRLDADDMGGLFRFVTQIDDWVMLEAQELGMDPGALSSFGSLRQWIELCIATLEEDFSRRGACALKCALAYRRSLDFEDIPADEAESDFQRMRGGETAAHPSKRVQDAVMRAILRWADSRRCILQIHTGYQEGNANLLGNANPEPLCGPIAAHPGIRFDLFHMGYPYQHIAGAMGKMFPNVRVNLCWAHMLSPVATKRALAEWLRLMPANKILGFGGDCRFYDGTVGHLELARRNIAKVLGDEVECGGLTKPRAIGLGRMLFYENPRSFYQL